MDSIKCPHCGEQIQLLDMSDLQKYIKGGPNKVNAMRSSGELPAPVLGGPSPQKYYWLESDVLEASVSRYVEQISVLPPELRKKIMAEIDGKEKKT